jgi:hypothetical protein
VWLEPPPGLATLPRPEVIWHEAAFAEVRFDTDPGPMSYFFEAKRRQLSRPLPDVLAADTHRQLMAQVVGRALVVRQIFSGREVLRIERDWASGSTVRDAITAIHFDPDTRVTISYLRGVAREAVTERISVPGVPR